MEITREFKNYIIKAEKLLRGESGVLKYICFHDDVRISGTNLNEWIEFNAPDPHGLNGVLLDVGKLRKVLTIFKWDAEIDREGDRVYVQKGKAKKYMDNDGGLTALHYPEAPQAVDVVGALDQRCIDAYNTCRRFASTDTTRAFMNGVYFSEKDDTVATDGRRMHLVKHEHVLKYPVTIGLSDQLENVLIAQAKVVSLGHGKNMLIVDTDENITYAIRDVQGQFPNYKRVIPTYRDADHQRVTVDKEFFAVVAEALQFMKVEKDKFNRVYVLKDRIAFSPQEYNASVAFDYERLIDTGFDSTFAANAQYLKDLSDAVGFDFDVRYNNAAQAIVFLRDDHVHVLMPMQLVSV